MPMDLQITKSGTKAWTFDWSAAGGTAPYRLVLNSRVLSETTTLTAWTIEGDDEYEPPALEVLDANDGEAASETYPSRATLQWRGKSNVYYYQVQESVASVWTNRVRVKEIGAGYYQHTTTELADCTASQWRVIAVDERGYESEPILFDFFPVRPPDPPSITLTYSALTGLVTVAAR